MGSPRVLGSTNRSKSVSRVASSTSSRCRPPPGRRQRDASTGVSSGGWRSSRMPAVMVVREKPVASATSDRPPRGKAKASVAAQCRRIRSVIVADNSLYFSRRLVTVTVVFMLSLSPHPTYCSSYFLTAPKEDEGQGLYPHRQPHHPPHDQRASHNAWIERVHSSIVFLSN